MLATLEQILEGLTLQEEVLPSGRPVKTGYISSEFGFRRDPFNGNMRMHKGLDFAGPIGTDIWMQWRAEWFSFVGEKPGYGNVVEVDHGDGLVSRYAHLNATFAKQGTVIKKGELVAWLGNTGRSTGALHLRVLKQGEQVNPRDYLGTDE